MTISLGSHIVTLKKFLEKQFARVHTPLGLASPNIFSVMPYKAGHVKCRSESGFDMTVITHP